MHNHYWIFGWKSRIIINYSFFGVGEPANFPGQVGARRCQVGARRCQVGGRYQPGLRRWRRWGSKGLTSACPCRGWEGLNLALSSGTPAGPMNLKGAWWVCELMTLKLLKGRQKAFCSLASCILSMDQKCNKCMTKRYEIVKIRRHAPHHCFRELSTSVNMC